MYERPEEMTGEGAKLWSAHHTLHIILPQPPRMPSEKLTDDPMNQMNQRRREMGQLALVRMCALNCYSAPQCLSERLKTNAEIGRQVTQGHDHHKLYVPQVKTEWYHKSFIFKGIQDWNSLPSEIRTLKSSTTFRTKLWTYVFNRL